MSYTFLLEQGEVFSAESFSDIPVSVLLRLSLIVEKSCSNAKETGSCQSSQFGTMCEHSMADRGGGELMLSVADSHARKSAWQVAANPTRARYRMVRFGSKWLAWFAQLSHDGFLWKTPQPWLIEGLEPSLETWPRWGIMRDGECFPQQMLEHFTYEKGYGYWPTPTRSDFHGASNATVEGRMGTLKNFLHFHFADKTLRTTCPNPDVSERLMQWPIGWTALQPLATDKFQAWLSSHGKH